MPDAQTFFIAAAILAAFLCGKLGARWRLGGKGRERGWRRKPQAGNKPIPLPRPTPERLDAADQLRVVMEAVFSPRKLLSRSEARVFQQVEKAVRESDTGWRVMAQVSLGEILSSPDARAYAAINSKRVDILIVSSSGDPVAAVEYQGSGHHLGSAAARDAVKREALRRAGVAFIEITPEHGAEDIVREVRRLRPGAPRPTSLHSGALAS